MLHPQCQELESDLYLNETKKQFQHPRRGKIIFWLGLRPCHLTNSKNGVKAIHSARFARGK
jgi:hypothetical protein